MLKVSGKRSEPIASYQGANCSKPEMFKRLVENGSVLVSIDSRAAGVSVPGQLLGSKWLTLEFGLQLRFPIPDLSFDELGVSGTLKFGNNRTFVFVPWRAVWALHGQHDEAGYLWPESSPYLIQDDVTVRN